ncbi:MAG: penicillin-binding transpeptidase domain-containing protein, partial [Tissierellaceae bacterium]
DFFSAKGAVIVTDIESGEILALASRPNFNQKNITAYLDKDDMALYNKAVQVSYPPGSIFKIVVLLAALEEDMGFLENSYFCKGYEVINNTTIKCSGNHGQISLRDGFAKSCNSVFIQIGKELGAKKIIDMAKRLGLGEKVNIGLAEEIEGILPEGEELLGPAIGNISIGQGKIEATPLQISNILLTIANDGVQKDMTLVKGITSKEGQILKAYNREEDKRVISKDLSQVAKELLEEVLSSGTARSLDLEDIGGAAGKTGSAEASLKGQFTIHGWFAGYYPKDEPRYGITILVEEASSGSKSAAPIFEKICKEINKNI